MVSLMEFLSKDRRLTRLKALARAIQSPFLKVQDAAIRLYGQASGRSNLVRETRQADDPLPSSRSEAVYVHFDREGDVADYVVHQLRELVDAGFRTTFVSNSPRLPERSWARVLPFCKVIIWRFNTGYDFGAYKDGIASIKDLDRLDRLILMNDSVYGPFRKLRDTLSGIDESRTDFWGITDSFEYRHHLQTFFMLFFSQALRSSAFQSFWRNLPYINYKRWIIRNCEVKLTQVLEGDGLRLGVLAPYWSVANSVKTRLLETAVPDLPPSERGAYLRFRLRILDDRAVNPMQYFWDSLIIDDGCPFIKRELIQSNPAGIPFTSHWSEIIAAHSHYDIGLIQRHLDTLVAAGADRGGPTNERAPSAG